MPIRKVLVVDDSPTDLANIKDIVTDAGCVVVTATSGAEAIAKAKADKPDLIFMDIVMPVSYTHLDVYKRQATPPAGPCIPRPPPRASQSSS